MLLQEDRQARVVDVARRLALFATVALVLTPQRAAPQRVEDARFDASAVTLDELQFKASQSFEYLFDFGDEWWHEITVEAIGTSSRAQSYPEFGARKGASPEKYAGDE